MNSRTIYCERGAEKINVTVYRWAEGTSMCIDDFLVKKIN